MKTGSDSVNITYPVGILSLEVATLTASCWLSSILCTQEDACFSLLEKCCSFWYVASTWGQVVLKSVQKKKKIVLVNRTESKHLFPVVLCCVLLGFAQGTWITRLAFLQAVASYCCNLCAQPVHASTLLFVLATAEQNIGVENGMTGRCWSKLT